MTQTDQNNQFNPNEHLLQLKSKAGSQDYLPVQWRLVWFRKECPNGVIETEEVEVDLDRVIEAEAFVWNAEKRRSDKVTKQAKGYARFRAVITDGKGGKATATGSESAADFGDYIEKAETKAIGRALAMLGYGTQFAPEFAENNRIVDAPVDSQPEPEQSETNKETTNNQRQNTPTTGQANNKPRQQFTKIENSQPTNRNPKTPNQLREELQELELLYVRADGVECAVDFDALIDLTFHELAEQGKVNIQKIKERGDQLPPNFCDRLEQKLEELKANRQQSEAA